MYHVLIYNFVQDGHRIANAHSYLKRVVHRIYPKKPYCVQKMVNGNQQNETILKDLGKDLTGIALLHRLTCVFVFITTDELCVTKNIPDDISHFSVLADGVIGRHEDSPLNSQLAASCLTIPEIDGLKIRYESEMDIDVLRNPEVKAILFFSDIEVFQRQQFEGARFPVVGGYVKKILPRDVGKLTAFRRSFRRSFQYIVVSGPAVKATSVVIADRINDADQIKEKLKKLNEENERERIKFRFAFMFIHNGSTKLSVESASFREIFPGVPLIGFRHTGQIGMDYPKQTDSTELNVFQDFSSVFLMVTVTEA